MALTFTQLSWSDGRRFHVDRDVIQVPVTGVEGAVVAVAESVHEGDQLLLISRHPYLQARDHTGAPASLFMVDDSPTCAVFMSHRTVLVHACQSERSISGAALFRVNSAGTIELAGVHTGFAGELYRADPARFRRNPNLADLNYGITAMKP